MNKYNHLVKLTKMHEYSMKLIFLLLVYCINKNNVMYSIQIIYY